MLYLSTMDSPATPLSLVDWATDSTSSTDSPVANSGVHGGVGSGGRGSSEKGGTNALPTTANATSTGRKLNGASPTSPPSTTAEHTQPRHSQQSGKTVGTINIYAGLAVDRIEFRFIDGSCAFVGGQGGCLKASLTLDDDEYVDQVPTNYQLPTTNYQLPATTVPAQLLARFACTVVAMCKKFYTIHVYTANAAPTHPHPPHPPAAPTAPVPPHPPQVKHETLVQRLYAGAGVEMRTNKRRRVACWPRIATRNAARTSCFTSSAPDAAIVCLVLRDGHLAGVVEGAAPVPSETSRDGRPMVSFYWLYTVEEKEFFRVKRRGFPDQQSQVRVGPHAHARAHARA